MARTFKYQLLIAVVLCFPVLAAAETAEYWLDRMSKAIRNLNYEGTFVYLHSGQLESMRIYHQAGEDGEKERLVSLNGAAREVLRDKDRVTCILPDNQSVVIDQSRPRRPFPTALTGDLSELARSYNFVVQGDDRVSGTEVRVIAIKPKDNLRYGYRLWLDKKTDMLLKSDLMDAAGTPVEQVMFTHFEVYDRMPEESLKPSLSGENYTLHDGMPAKSVMKSPLPAPRWNIDRLPEGFKLEHHNRHSVPSTPFPVEHLVYSDGLATVSVYVEPQEQVKESLAGLSSMGAVNAYGGKVSGYQVTVVGEVPSTTVELIGQSARLVR